MKRVQIGIVLAALVALSSTLFTQQAPMSFFVTSTGPGDGANLGGLEGADAHCQMLATGVGRGSATWRAYLSTQGPNAVNARDRIGTGPWHNAQGGRIGRSVAEIHGVDEDGNPIRPM